MAKYIDAEKLIKKIKQKQQEYLNNTNGVATGSSVHLNTNDLLKIIDSLQQEQPCGDYDEAYLQEKIALKEKHGSWKDGIKQLEYLNKIYFKEQSCDTCTNDKGCVTCKDGELWEGKEVNLENKECELVTADEDIITIHLGKVLTEKQYDAVLHSVIDHLNKHWWHILRWSA